MQSIDWQSDVSSVVFAGGVVQEDMDSNYISKLADDDADELRRKLTPHIGRQASHELPKDSGAIVGSYTEEEAEKWIAEYEEAMGEASENEG